MTRLVRTASPFVPNAHTLGALRAAIPNCRACELYRFATQAVFGEGHKTAQIFVLGEQPGNDEDLEGRPFVGPAGKLLDRALESAAIERDAIYVTNAVKHFKFEERGKRRLHKKPNTAEIRACRPWLDAEIQIVKPRVLLCLGATAAQTIFGLKFKLLEERGKLFEHAQVPHALATLHPAAILRIPDQKERHHEFEKLVDDLRIAASAL